MHAHPLPSHLSNGGGGATPVRLPPVSMIPRDEFLQPQHGFNPGRRVSITDPFLHAYPPPPPPADANGGTTAPPYDSQTTPQPQQQQSQPNRRPSDDKLSMHSPTSRTGSPALSGGGRAPSSRGGSSSVSSSTMGPPQRGYVIPAPNYEFGSSFGTSSGAHNGNGGYPPPAPSSNYRFGGASSGGTPNGNGEPGPSYFDYSMRRHSLTQGGGGGHPSPPRLPSMDAPVSSLKRKSSGELEQLPSLGHHGEEGYHYPSYQSHLSGAPPYAKRRGSSLTFDKLGNLSLNEQQRRDSMMSGAGPGSAGTNPPPWGDEDSRRGSGGSYGSAGSHGGYVSSSGYSSVPTPVDHYDQRAPHLQQQQYGHGPPPPHHPQQHQRHPSDHQYPPEMQYPPQHVGNVGPRGSILIPPGPSQHAHLDHAPPNDPSYGANRRPSGPGMVYGHPPPPSPSYPHPQHPQAQLQQQQQAHPRPPSSMLPSVAHSPPEDEGLHAAQAHHLPPAQQAWARAGPLPVSNPQAGVRNGSLDPLSAYGPGGKMDTPYSRSPELRVSHKLAERKRRKEMAQLFDELRDSLPVDRGLKSSKWEILSKAVDFIASLKEHNTSLQQDNTMLRDHFGLPPGPQLARAAPPQLPGPPTLAAHPPHSQHAHLQHSPHPASHSPIQQSLSPSDGQDQTSNHSQMSYTVVGNDPQQQHSVSPHPHHQALSPHLHPGSPVQSMDNGVGGGSGGGMGMWSALSAAAAANGSGGGETGGEAVTEGREDEEEDDDSEGAGVGGRGGDKEEL